jgi:hypothetical protein
MTLIHAVLNVLSAVVPTAFLLSVALAASAPAQTFTGTVTDATSGAPLADVTITLVDHVSGGEVGRVLADSQGVFSVAAQAPGVFRVRAERLGFHAAASPVVRLGAGGSFPVELRMHSRSVRLEEVVVTGRATPAFRNRVGRAFFDRMERRDGHFFTPEMLAAREPVLMSTLLQGLPGMRSTHGGQYVRMRRSVGSDGPRVCVPTVYVNGDMAPLIRPLDDMVDRDRLWGIEVYTSYLDAPAGLPPHPRRRDCGVIAIWTIDG